MNNVQIQAQSVIDNLLEQNKKLVLEVATLQAAVTELTRAIEEESSSLLNNQMEVLENE